MGTPIIQGQNRNAGQVRGRTHSLPVKLLFLFLVLGTSVSSLQAQAGPALLFDYDKGRVLYAEDPDARWHPASLVKLMTAYLTFEAIKKGKLSLTDKVVATETSQKAPPSKIGLPVGAEMTVDTALRALIVKSANDVAIMLAGKIGGSVPAFVRRMNATAKRLGMRHTHFVNPNGLHEPAQVTTARDMAHLARAILRDFPERAGYFAQPRMKLGKRVLRSYNSLLRKFDGADGMKTGFICASGYNIVASATRNGKRLIAVVLGSRTPAKRHARAESLLSYGFEYLPWKLAFSKLDIDSLPEDSRASDTPRNMRALVCRRPVRKKRRRAVRRKRKPAVKQATRTKASRKSSTAAKRKKP